MGGVGTCAVAVVGPGGGAGGLQRGRIKGVVKAAYIVGIQGEAATHIQRMGMACQYARSRAGNDGPPGMGGGGLHRGIGEGVESSKGVTET